MFLSWRVVRRAGVLPSMMKIKTFIMSAIFMAFLLPQYLRVSVLLDMGEAMGSCSCSNSGASCAGYVVDLMCGRVTGECKSNEVYPGTSASSDGVSCGKLCN